MKIKVSGYSASEGVREFDVLSREDIEEAVSNLDPAEIFIQTYRKAEGYSHSGYAYAYVDARDGSVNVDWLGNNTELHPWDSFYRILVCHLNTGDNFVGHYYSSADYLLDEEEYRDWQEAGYPDIEQFLGTKEFNRRLDEALDAEASTYDFDWQKISAQLDELYS